MSEPFLNPGPDDCLGERFTGLESCDAHLVFIQDLSGIFQYALIVIRDHDPFRQSDHRLFPMCRFCEFVHVSIHFTLFRE